MKLAVPALFAAFAAITSAQNDVNQTSPFYLQLKSNDTKLNNLYLTPYHAGAAIEVLGLVNTVSQRDQFRLNYTQYQSPSNGILTWILRGANFNVSSVLVIESSLFSNVAVPTFYPGNARSTMISFDQNEMAYLDGGIDDTKLPLNTTIRVGDVKRWYVCRTYTGYLYTTLAWVIGIAAPQNPSCVKVDVKRVFATGY